MSLMDLLKSKRSGVGADAVRALLQENPGAINEKTEKGSTPLHYGLCHQAPGGAIAAVLAAHPAAAKEKNKEGWTPLHFGLQGKAPGVVIAAVLAAHPAAAKEKNNLGDLPLHLGLENEAPADAIVAVLAAHPAAAKEKNVSGDLPLHVGLRNQAPADAIVAVLAAHPAAAKEKTGGGWTTLHLGLENEAPGDVIAAVLAAHPAAAKEKDQFGDLPLHDGLRKKAPADVLAAVLAAHPIAEMSWMDLLKMGSRAPADAVAVAFTALPDGDPAAAVRTLSAKHGHDFDHAALASATALFVGEPPADPKPAFEWMAAMLDKAPTDHHVQAAILQMLGNSHSLATAQRTAALFVRLKTTALDLLNRRPASLHAYAAEHGMARDVGPAELHDTLTNQRGVLELLKPWIRQEAVTAAAAFDGVDPDEVMLCVLCMLGHAATTRLQVSCPELGAKQGRLLWADPKTVDRMRIKWKTEYGRDLGALLDFIRFSLTSPDQAAQEQFLAPMLPDKRGDSKSEFVVRRIKSTHSDRAAQVKQCLVNLEWRPGITFGELLANGALAAAAAASRATNAGVSETVRHVATTVLGHVRLAERPVRIIVEAQLYLPYFLAQRKSVHIFYKVSRANGLAELAQDCAKYATNADMAFVPEDAQSRRVWAAEAAQRLARWAGINLTRSPGAGAPLGSAVLSGRDSSPPVNRASKPAKN